MWKDGSCSHETTLTKSLMNNGMEHCKTAVQPRGEFKTLAVTLYAWLTTEKNQKYCRLVNYDYYEFVSVKLLKICCFCHLIEKNRKHQNVFSHEFNLIQGKGGSQTRYPKWPWTDWAHSHVKIRFGLIVFIIRHK